LYKKILVFLEKSKW